jgi:hypothetical protein
MGRLDDDIEQPVRHVTGGFQHCGRGLLHGLSLLHLHKVLNGVPAFRGSDHHILRRFGKPRLGGHHARRSGVVGNVHVATLARWARKPKREVDL